MAQFLGLPILCQLSNGSALEGTLSSIDVASGTLTLDRVLLHRDGFEVTSVPTQSVQRSQVKDIQVLSLKATSHNGAKTASAPVDDPSHPSQTILPSAPSPSTINVKPGNHHVPHLPDPAILQVGRKAPRSDASDITSQSNRFSPHTALTPNIPAAPASVRPAPSSLASNSTVAAFSTASGPTGPRAQHQQPLKDRSSARAALKKKQSAYVANNNIIRGRFGGAETAGSEADESHVANSEAPMIRRKGTNSSLRPRQQFVTSLQPDDTEADATSEAPSGGFDEDFDFSRGLASFNKQQVFDEIREADRTDPNSRLVAHNRRGSPNRFTTKLKYNENVLDASETDDAPETHRYQAFYSGLESSSILPHDTITEGVGSTTDNDTINSDDGAPARLRAAVSNLNLNSNINGNGNGGAHAHTPPVPAKQLLTTEGVRVPVINDKIWREIQQLCNIESGPNMVQRVENGARGIASAVLRELAKARHLPAGTWPENIQSSVVVLCTPSTKANYGLRAGAHLANHGINITAFVPQTDQQLPPTFEFNLRLFSAAGGKVVRTAFDLPEYTDAVIDALTDNELSGKKSKYDNAIAEAVSWALSCTPTGTNISSPVISIDLPSNTDPDTGAVTSGAIWSLTPSVVVALGLIKQPSVVSRYALYLVDIGIPTTTIERAGVKSYKRPFMGDTWVSKAITSGITFWAPYITCLQFPDISFYRLLFLHHPRRVYWL